MAQALINDVIIHTNLHTFAFPNSKRLVAHPLLLILSRWVMTSGSGKIEVDAAKMVLDLGEPNYYRTRKAVMRLRCLYFSSSLMPEEICHRLRGAWPETDIPLFAPR